MASNRKIVERYYRELWNAWDLAVADQVLSSEIVFRGSLGIDAHGIGEFKNYAEFVHAAFPDFHNQVEEMVSEGSKVVTRLTYTGTHSGSIFDVEATGRRVGYSGVAIFRIETGMTRGAWVPVDTLSLRRQIGAPSS